MKAESGEVESKKEKLRMLYLEKDFKGVSVASTVPIALHILTVYMSR